MLEQWPKRTVVDIASEQEISALLSKSSSLARVNIVFSDDPQMVMAINTYGDKLQKPDLIINRQVIKHQRNLTDPQIIYILEHEMGHYDEEAKLRAIPDGQAKYEEHIQTMEQRWPVLRNKLWSFENAMRDVWVNKRTERLTPILWLETQRLYKDIFFTQANYLSKPLHIQLEYTILREMMFPDEQCVVDPRVRSIMNWLQRPLPWGRRIDLLADGTLTQRYDFYEQEMRPKRLELYKIDVWEKKHEDWTDAWKTSSKRSPTRQDLDALDLPSEPDYREEETHDQLPHLLDQLSPEQQEALLDKMFEQALEEQAVIDREMQEKAGQDAKQQQEAKKSDRQKQLEQRVEQMGIARDDKNFTPTINQLAQYEDYVAKLIDQVRDESWKKVFDQLITLFDAIKSENTKYRHHIRGPVDQEHGERLYDRMIASGIASVLWGETNPEMRAKDTKKEKLKQYRGNIEVDIFADGTGSMDTGTRTRDQKQAVILMLEALKKLEEKSLKSTNPLITPFKIQTSMSVFGKRSRRVKELWSGVSDTERINIFQALNENDGPRNNEWVLLEKARQEFVSQPQAYKDGIKKWFPKKIIFILTDGWQDVTEYKQKLEQAVQNFREAWVIVYGVAMCEDVDDVDEIYGTPYAHQWWAVHCGTTQNLWNALSRTIQPHLLRLTTLKT